MGLIAHPVALKEKSRNLCNAFLAGAPKEAHGHVFYGVDNTNWDAWRRVRVRKEPFWYIDNSYFDSVRGQQFRVTYNAVQVPLVRMKHSTGERFAALGLEIRPWQRNLGGYWLVIEQSPAFMEHIAQDRRWLENNVACLGDAHRVKVRRWKSDKLAQQATLPQDLVGAWCCLTHSSAAAVTATLAGIPVSVSKMSALADMVGSFDESIDQRRQYMNALADNQFTIREMENGTAWQMLNQSHATD